MKMRKAIFTMRSLDEKASEVAADDCPPKSREWI
jgi:hypothetical protein